MNRFAILDASTFIYIGDRTLIDSHSYITDHDRGPAAPIDAHPFVTRNVAPNARVGM